MLFKNLRVYQLKGGFHVTLSELEQATAKKPARECQNLETDYLGFDYVFPGSRLRVYPLHNEQVLYLKLGLYQRVLPPAVVKEQASKRIKKLEKERGEPVRKKERKEITDEVRAELLQKAFQRKSDIQILIDLGTGCVWVDQTSAKKAENALTLVRNVLSSLPVKPVEGNLAPQLKAWIENSSPLPEGYDLGANSRLVDEADEKSHVTVRREDLTTEEILALLDHRFVSELALEKQDVASFTLTEDYIIKGIKPLVKPDRSGEETPADRFDGDLSYTWHELSSLISDIRPAASAQASAS